MLVYIPSHRYDGSGRLCLRQGNVSNQYTSSMPIPRDEFYHLQNDYSQPPPPLASFPETKHSTKKGHIRKTSPLGKTPPPPLAPPFSPPPPSPRQNTAQKGHSRKTSPAWKTPPPSSPPTPHPPPPLPLPETKHSTKGTFTQNLTNRENTSRPFAPVEYRQWSAEARVTSGCFLCCRVCADLQTELGWHCPLRDG